MKLVEITSVAELIEIINNLPNHYIYRGQADSSWGLQSSLERVVGVGWSSDSLKGLRISRWGAFNQSSTCMTKRTANLIPNLHGLPQCSITAYRHGSWTSPRVHT